MYDLVSYTSGSDRHDYTISFGNGTNGENMISYYMTVLTLLLLSKW